MIRDKKAAPNGRRRGDVVSYRGRLTASPGEADPGRPRDKAGHYTRLPVTHDGRSRGCRGTPSLSPRRRRSLTSLSSLVMLLFHSLIFRAQVGPDT